MMEANLVSTPLSKTTKLILPIGSNKSLTIDVPYAKATRSSRYAALRTQPNIAFTIQHLSQFTMPYGQEHWTAIRKYTLIHKGIQDNGITFR